jgi:glyoxylase-like metal-dependent hydrolase (beta-lactamase superfamily II)
MTTRAFGDITVTAVVELDGPMFPPENLFPDHTPDMIEGNRDWLYPTHIDTEQGLLVMPIQSFLIKTPHHTILVDGCFGNGKERPNPKISNLNTPWLDRLAAAGAAPGQVDFVMCTHLHGDHVGWNTRLENGRWVPTFPNARYLFGKDEWAYWGNPDTEFGRPTPHLNDSVLPVVEAGLMEVVDGGHEIEDAVFIDPLPGHTPGHAGLHIRNGGGEAILIGDMIHHPLQIAHPDLCSDFCVDKPLARATRRNFLETYADTAVTVVPSHFPDPIFGHIVSKGGGFGWKYAA